MAITPSEGEPTEFTVGDTLTWLKTLASYLPDDDWILSYSLVSPSYHISISATDNGDGKHLVNTPGSSTELYKPGTYTLVGFVGKDSDRVQVYKGTLIIYPNYQALTSGLNGQEVDATSKAPRRPASAQDILDKILIAIEEKLSGGAVSSYSVEGRSFQHMSLMDLEELKDKYKREISRSRGIVSNTNRFTHRP